MRREISRFFAAGWALVAMVRAQTAGALDPAFATGAGADATVQAVVALPEGGAIVAGNFTVFDGVPRTGLARLDADGHVDTSFAPNFKFPADGGLFAVLVQPDGKILVGGYFSDVNSVGRRTLVRLLPTGLVDTTFQPNFPAESAVIAIALDASGAVYAGGTFATVGGANRSSVVRLRSDGGLDPAFTAPPLGAPLPGPLVTSIVLQQDGNVLLAGRFQTAAANARWDNLLRLQPDGQIDPTFDSSGAVGSDTVASVALDAAGNIFIAGEFPFSGDQGVQPLRRLKPDGTRDSSFAPKFGPGTATWPRLNTLLIEPSGRILVGGDFAVVNGAAQPWLARLLVDGSRDERFMPGGFADAAVATLARDRSGRILMGGDFQHVDGVAAVRIARLLNPPLPPRVLQDPQAAVTTTGGNVALRVRVEAGGVQTYQWFRDNQLLVGETDSELYLVNATAGGSYRVEVRNDAGVAESAKADVTVLPRLAGGIDATFVPDPVTENAPASDNVYRFLAVRPDGRVLAEVGGFGEHLIVQLLRDGRRDPGFLIHVPNPSGSVQVIDRAALQPDGRLLVNFSGPPVLRRYGADGTLDLTFALRGFSPQPSSLPAQIWPLPDGGLLLSGSFTIGADPYCLVRTGSNGDLDATFSALSIAAIGGAGVNWLYRLDDGRILIAGTFSSVRGESRPGLARLSASGELDRSYHPTVAFSPGGVAANGAGVVYGSNPVDGVVRLREDASVDPGFSAVPAHTETIGNRTFEITTAAAIFLQQDGNVWLQGNFSRLGGMPVRSPVRLLRDGKRDATFDLAARPTRAGVDADNVTNVTIVGEWAGRFFFDGKFDAVAGQPRPGLVALYKSVTGEAPLKNLSTRAWAGHGEEIVIAGFAIDGAAPRPLLVRGVGPALAGFGVAGALAEPQLELFRGPTSLVRNGGWMNAAEIAAAGGRNGAFALPSGSRDAALVTMLAAATYTAQVSGAGTSEGVTLAEIYLDDGDAHTRLTNLSTRAVAMSGDRAVITGFSIGGASEKQVLIRAVGPTLKGFGVATALDDPRLRVVQGGVTIAQNDNWGDDAGAGFSAAAARQAGGFPLAAASRDAALLVTLAPGNYTVVIEPVVPENRGIVLAEIYEVTR